MNFQSFVWLKFVSQEVVAYNKSENDITAFIRKILFSNFDVKDPLRLLGKCGVQKF